MTDDIKATVAHEEDDKSQKSIRQLLVEKDQVTLCESDGKIIGREDKLKAHELPAKMHLAISVWLFNSKGEVLLQKRSKKKIVGGDWWGNTVCGNVWPTETYYQCALRRLKVELGINGEITIKPIYKFAYKAFGNEKYAEHELDQVYVGFFQDEVFPNPDEVSEFMWADFKELFSAVTTLEYISPEESLSLDTLELTKKTKPVELEIAGKKLLIAPWTIFMLKNMRLYDEFKQILKNQ